MKEIIVIGAGDTARDIVEAIEATNASVTEMPEWRLLGFLDDNPSLLNQHIDGYPVLGKISDSNKFPKAHFALGISSSAQPGRRCSALAELNVGSDRLATIVHPRAQVSSRAVIGPGSVVLSNGLVSRGAKLGCSVIVSQNASILHDSMLGDFVDVAPGAIVGGRVTVEAGVYLDMNCIIMPNKRVCANAVIGIGCIVKQNVDRK